MAVVIVMTVLVILLIFVAGNIRTLHLLNRDLKLVEKRQIQRLQATNPQPSVLTGTNQPPAQTNSPAK